VRAAWGAVAAALLGCGSARDGHPSPADRGGGHEPPATAPTPPSAAPPSAWVGEPIEPRIEAPESAAVPLADVVAAVQTAHGWAGLRVRTVGNDLVNDLVDATGVVATAPSFYLIGDRDPLYVLRYDDFRLTQVSRLVGRKLVPLSGTIELKWTFGAVGIANDTRDLHTQYWQTVAIGATALAVVETGTGVYATGATRVGDDVVVAAREHDPKASVDAKAAAVMASERGDHRAMAAIVGQPRGWLLHVDGNGHVTHTEAFPDQTPGLLASTASGWLVIATDGTAAGGFQDGVVVARAPGDPALHLLARDIASASQLTANGDWACWYAMPGESRVVHCVDPVRRLHVATPPLPDNVTLYGIERGAAARLLLRHAWYPHGYGQPEQVDTLALALP
jgi:hypothetical protein